jgi:predicted dehydrogenase
MLGDPVSVVAEIDNVFFPPEIPEDSGVAIYRFPNKAMAILINNGITLAGENTTEIYGDGGTIVQNHGDGVSTSLRPPAPIALKMFQQHQAARGWQDLGFDIPSSHGDRIASLSRAFVDWLHDKSEAVATLEDGKKSVEMVLGAYQSAREGRRVGFPL